MMEPTDAIGSGSLPLSMLRRMVADCDHFETEWRAGRSPRVEVYLAGAEPAIRSALLLRLLAVELELRGQCGEHPDPDEYRDRFPEDFPLIAAAFAEAASILAGPIPVPSDGAGPGPRSARDLARAPGDPAATAHGGAGPGRGAPVVPGYQILSELGRGGMGVVYLARRLMLDRPCALKMILAGLHADPEASVRFLAEAEAIAKLRHPNVVEIFSVGEADGHLFLELEYVAGGSLAARLDGTPWPAGEVARLIEALARGVAEAHRLGVIHRDIKPANVLLAADGTPKLADFGLAKAMGVDSGLTQTQYILGTPSYMAPEQAAGGARGLGPTADIYTLGAVLYELLTGRPPFKAATPEETRDQVRTTEPVPPARLVPRLPRDVETICLKCLRKEPARRYPSADELAEDLRRFLAGEPIKARRTGPLGRTWRWARRNRAVAALLATVALLSVSITIISVSMLLLNRERLREAYVAQAQAVLWSGRLGRRLASLEALTKAATIRPSPELRDEAIASLGVEDLRVLRRWSIPDLHSYIPSFDAALERYAYFDAQGVVHVRRTSDDQELARLTGLKGGHGFTTFGPDGHSLAAAFREVPAIGSVVLLWDLDHPHSAPKRFEREAGDMDFSADGRSLAVSHKAGSIEIYSLSSHRSSFLPKGLPDFHIRYHPGNGRLAATTWSSNEVAVIDVMTGAALTFVAPAPTRLLLGVAWSGDGRLLAAGDDRGRVFVWSPPDPEPRAVLEGQGAAVVILAFNHSGTRLVSNSWDGTAKLWDPMGHQPLLSVMGQLYHFGRDGRRLAYCTNIEVRIYELAGDRERRTLYHDRRVDPNPVAGAPWSVDVHPGGRLIASAYRDGVRLWDAVTGRPLAHLPDENHGYARFDPDGTRLLTCSPAGLRLWPLTHEPEEWRLGPPKTLPVVTPPIDYVRMAWWRRGEKARIAVSWGYDEVLLLDPDHPSTTVRLGGLRNVTETALSPDGRWAAAGSWAGMRARVWDTTDGHSVKDFTPNRPDLRVPYAAFSPAGDAPWLVVSWQDQYRFYRVGTWEPGPVLSHEQLVPWAPVAFSRDGRLLAVTDVVGLVRLKDPASLRTLATLSLSEPVKVMSLGFSPDSRLLTAGTDGAMVQVWDLERIRRSLATLGLDWDRPPYNASGDDAEDATRLEVRVVEAPWSAVARQAEADARAGRWAEAAAGFARAIELGADGLETWHRHLLVQVRMGDLRGYRRNCKALLERFRSDDASTRNLVNWCCALGPGAVPDLAERAGEVSALVARDRGEPNFQNTLGAALYRAGRFAESLRPLNTAIALEGGGGLPYDWLFLAMAHHRLGNAAGAKVWLAKAAHWLELADAGKVQSRWVKLPLPWDQRLELEILAREASTILRESGPDLPADVFADPRDPGRP
jgi:serine/threonine protein kinase/WD40 repeat protein